jgi:hypothetical protein
MSTKTRKGNCRKSRGAGCAEELRTGASGVPLALAEDLHRDVLINGLPPRKTAAAMGLSDHVAARMLKLMRRHGVPSVNRRILLSVGYPDRTYAEIAAAFRTTVDHVNEVVLRASSLRRAEPLSTELWEDITEKTMMPDELYARAAEVRRLNELDKREVPGAAGGCAPGGESLGGFGTRPWSRRRPRPKGCPSGA